MAWGWPGAKVRFSLIEIQETVEQIPKVIEDSQNKNDSGVPKLDRPLSNYSIFFGFLQCKALLAQDLGKQY